jgi:putative ABC transport system permease protein
MSVMRLLRRLGYLLRQHRHARELAEEMAFHRSMTTGRSFGNGPLAAEDARNVWIGTAFESFLQDLRYAARCLRREPAFAALAIVTLGVTIGLNTSVFTAFNAIMYRPWPVADPARVFTIADAYTRSDFSIGEARYFAGHARTVAGFVGTRCINGLSEGCEVDLDGAPALAHLVTGNYFDVLGVPMQRGRSFDSSDDRSGSPSAVAVISNGAWKLRFGGDPGIVGRRIRLDDVPFTVIGVAPATFTGTAVDRKDVWIPLSAISLVRPNDPDVRDRFEDPRRSEIALAARLASGISPGEAQAELAVLNQQFRRSLALEDHGLRLMPTTFFNNPFKRKGVVPVFALLFVGVLLVLLLACANVGNLLLARATVRRREIALRLSLGAARGRIVRQLLTESLVLAAGAATIGVLLAFELPELVLTRFDGPVSWQLRPDAAVLAFTAGLACLTCLAFGLAPALHAVKTDIAGALSASADRIERGAIRLSLRSVLLSAQVAISVVLLVCAGLLVRGVSHGYSSDLGFAVQGVRTMSFDLPASYEPARREAFARSLVQSAADTPGGVGWTTLLPFGRLELGVNSLSFRLPSDPPGGRKRLVAPAVSSGFFEVLGIPLVQGRFFLAGDAAAGAAIVNESMARAHWPGQNPLGHTLIADTERHVVGVVKDVIYTTGFTPEPTMYRPLEPGARPQLLFRAGHEGAAQSIAELARQINPRVRIVTAPFEEPLDRRFSGSRMAALIASVLGLLSVALAAIGVFGVFRYIVQHRTREIGIRIALGARPGQVIRFVVGSGARALVVGLVLGLAGAGVASALLRGSLHGLSSLDPGAYAGAAAIIIAAGLGAVYWPSRHATRVEPVAALRCE